jgi:hypothetical protein
MGGAELGVTGPDERDGPGDARREHAAGGGPEERAGGALLGVLALREVARQLCRLCARGLVNGRIRSTILGLGLVNRDGFVGGIAQVDRSTLVLELCIRLAQVDGPPALEIIVALDAGDWELSLPGRYVGD